MGEGRVINVVPILSTRRVLGAATVVRASPMKILSKVNCYK